MAAITVESYGNIENYYTGAQEQLVGLADYYYLAAVEIVTLNTFDPELALLSPFYNAYLAADAAYLSPPNAVIVAVGELQRHILDKARTSGGVKFTDINQWYDAADTNKYLTIAGAGASALGRQTDSDQSSIQMSSEFAALSATAGFTIDGCNVVGATCTPGGGA